MIELLNRALLPNCFFVGVGIFTFASTLLLFIIGKWEIIPQLWVSIAVAMLSYWACLFSADRMRLDLLDRRFEIYEKVLTFCNAVFAHGSLEPTEANRKEIETALEAAHQSFRGIGLHKAKALFGRDIVRIFDELNKSFAYIIAYGGQGREARDYNAETYWKHVRRITEHADKLPEHFKPYMYFGDIKRT